LKEVQQLKVKEVQQYFCSVAGNKTASLIFMKELLWV